jgi:hypothetical protein
MRERRVLLGVLLAASLVASTIACEGSGAAPTTNAAPMANAAPLANVASPAPSLSSPLREEPAPRGGNMVRLGAHFRHHISGAAMGDGRVKGTCAATPQLTSGP